MFRARAAGADALPRSGYVKCEPSGPLADGPGAVPLMLTYSQPGSTATPAAAPAAAAAARQQGLTHITPVSRVSAAGLAAGGGSAAVDASANITPAAGAGLLAITAQLGPAAADAAGAHATPLPGPFLQTGVTGVGMVTSVAPQPAAEQEEHHLGGQAGAAAAPDNAADVDMVPPHEETAVPGQAIEPAAQAQTPAPVQHQMEDQTPQPQHHARVKDEPLDEAPLGEPQPQQDEAQQEAAQQEAQQEAQAGPATEPPGTRPAKTPANSGVDAVLNECKDIVSSVSEVLFPTAAAGVCAAGDVR